MAKDKHPGGRPTKYEDRFIQGLIDFFNVEPYEKISNTDKEGNTKVTFVPNKFPTLARYACEIGVCKDTLYEWSVAKTEDGELKHPEFSAAYKKAKSYQEAVLVEGSMVGAFATTFAIFTAKNVLGWRDKQEDEVNNTVIYKVVGGLPNVSSK